MSYAEAGEVVISPEPLSGNALYVHDTEHPISCANLDLQLITLT